MAALKNDIYFILKGWISIMMSQTQARINYSEKHVKPRWRENTLLESSCIVLSRL